MPASAIVVGTTIDSSEPIEVISDDDIFYSVQPLSEPVSTYSSQRRHGRHPRRRAGHHQHCCRALTKDEAAISSSAAVVAVPSCTEVQLADTGKRASRSAFMQLLWRDLFPQQVAPYLLAHDVCNAALVCRESREYILRPCVWRTLCERGFGVSPALIESAIAGERTNEFHSINIQASGSRSGELPVPVSFTASNHQHTSATLRHVCDAAAISVGEAFATARHACSSPSPASQGAVVMVSFSPPPSLRAASDPTAHTVSHRSVFAEMRNSRLFLDTGEEHSRREGSPCSLLCSLHPSPCMQSPSPEPLTGTDTGTDIVMPLSPTATAVTKPCHADHDLGIPSQAAQQQPAGTEELLMCAATASRSLFEVKSPFPWRRFFVWLYTHRVANFLQMCVWPHAARAEALQNEISEHREIEDQQGKQARAVTEALWSLNTAITVLLQGGCGAPEHANALAALLVRRAGMREVQARLVATNRGVEGADSATENTKEEDEDAAAIARSDTILADLAMAELLVPSISATERVEQHLALRRRTQEDCTMGGIQVANADAAANLESFSPASAGKSARTLIEWMAAYDAAATGADPLARIGVLRECIYYATTSPRTCLSSPRIPRQEQQQHSRSSYTLFMAYVTLFILAVEEFQYHAVHLLRAASAACAKMGPVEALVLQALRRSCPDRSGSPRSYTESDGKYSLAAAVEQAEMAVSLIPQRLRAAAESQAAMWVKECVMEPQIALPDMMNYFSSRAACICAEVRAARSVSHVTPRAEESDMDEDDIIGQATVAGIAYYVFALLTLKTTNGTAAACEALTHCVALSVSSKAHALALAHLATQYAAVAAVMDTQDLTAAAVTTTTTRAGALHGEAYQHQQRLLQLPFPTNVHSSAVSMRLLHSALALDPYCYNAYVLLSRLYTRAADPMAAYKLLTRCIHLYAVPYETSSGASSRGAARHQPSSEAPLRESPSFFEVQQQQQQQQQSVRKEVRHLGREARSPGACFIPAALLIERSRCVPSHSLAAAADLDEATSQNPRLSYPYQARAAAAMDAGSVSVADKELNDVTRLTMQSVDVSLRLRLTLDALGAARNGKIHHTVPISPSPPLHLTAEGRNSEAQEQLSALERKVAEQSSLLLVIPESETVPPSVAVSPSEIRSIMPYLTLERRVAALMSVVDPVLRRGGEK